MADGRWQMGDGRWEMADGRWQMGDGRWQMEDGRWKRDDETTDHGTTARTRIGAVERRELKSNVEN
jgi:hypothetical protein